MINLHHRRSAQNVSLSLTLHAIHSAVSLRFARVHLSLLPICARTAAARAHRIAIPLNPAHSPRAPRPGMLHMMRPHGSYITAAAPASAHQAVACYYYTRTDVPMYTHTHMHASFDRLKRSKLAGALAILGVRRQDVRSCLPACHAHAK